MTSNRLYLNPFHHQGPVQDLEIFFDRESDVKRVLNRVRRGASASIVGREKIGKTSFLHHVANPRVAAAHGLSPPTHLFFYVDCKRLAGLSEDDSFRQIKAVVERIVSTWAQHFITALQDIVSSTAYDWLRKACLLFEAEGIQPIVQLDDFDWLAANSCLSAVFFHGLRALTSVHNTMAYTTASRLPLIELEHEASRTAGSPFYNIFHKFELQPFSPDESRRFLVTRLESVGAAFPEIIMESLCDLSRGEPYHLQVAGACAYDIWCENGCRLSEEHWGEIKKRFGDVMAVVV